MVDLSLGAAVAGALLLLFAARQYRHMGALTGREVGAAALAATPLALLGLAPLGVTLPAPAAAVGALLVAAGGVAPSVVVWRHVARRVGARGGRRVLGAAVWVAAVAGVASAVGASVPWAPGGAPLLTGLAAALAVLLQWRSLAKQMATAERSRAWMEGLDATFSVVGEAAWGLSATGSAAGSDALPVTVELVTTQWPPWARVRVTAPGLPFGAVVRARRDTDPPSQLADPLLSSQLTVEGVKRPDALVRDRHGELLSVLAGRPGSVVARGVVWLVQPIVPGAADAPSPTTLVAEAVELARSWTSHAPRAAPPAPTEPKPPRH